MSARVVAAGVAALLALGAGAAAGPRHEFREAAVPSQMSVMNAADLTPSPRLRIARAVPALRAELLLSRDVLTIAPDGRVVASVHGDRLTPAGAEPVAGDVELIAPDGTSTTLPEPTNDPLLKAAGADADDATIAWVEDAADSFDAAHWRYLAYDRRTGSTTVIAGDRDFRPDDDLGYSSGPMLGGGRVYWSVSHADPSNPYGQTDRLYSRDVAGLGPIVRMLDDVRNVSVSGDTLCYTRDDGRYYPSRWVTIHRRNVHSGVDQMISRVTLGPGEEFGGLSCSASTAWVVTRSHGDDPPDSRLVVRDEDGREAVIAGGYFVPPTVTPELVVWPEAGPDGHLWVLDRARRLVGTLGNADPHAEVRATGRYVAWSTETEWQVGELTAP